MNRNQILCLLITVCFLGTSARAQIPAQVQPGQRGQSEIPIVDTLSLLRLLPQGGGPGQRGGAPILETRRVVRSATVPQNAWWTDTALVRRLGLSEDQMRRIENTFEAHRQNLTANAEQLEREETQLSRLLEAESIDRSSISTQINRVIQARGDMERTNAMMMLEMREQLTRAQWTQLQNSQLGLRTARVAGQDLLNPPSTAPTGETPTRIGGDIALKNLVSSVDPTYPPLARASRIVGNVILQTVISKEGAVTELKVINGHPLLNDAAMDAVRQWRFKPQLLNGQPVTVITTITVRFDNP